MLFVKICYGIGNMHPTETPQNNPEHQEQTKDAAEQHLDDAIALQASDAARRQLELFPSSDSLPAPIPAHKAAGMKEKPIPLNEEIAKHQKKQLRVEKLDAIGRKAAKGVVASAIGVASIAGIAHVGSEALKKPEFTEETTTVTVEDGDGYHSIASHIRGVDSIDIRDAAEHIKADPANIDVLKNGLEPGEVITIPVAVVGHENDPPKEDSEEEKSEDK